MPLFEITPEIQILAKPITPGWHGLEITKIEDKVNDKGVTVTLFSHKVIDGPHKGAYVFVNVSHDENMAYNMDYLNFITNGAFLKPVKGKEKREVTVDNVIKQFDGEITNKQYEGRTMNNLKRVKALTRKAAVAEKA